MDDKVITHKSLLIILWEKVFKNLKNEQHLLLCWNQGINQNCFLFIKQRTSYYTLLVTLTLNKLNLIHPHCHQCDQPFLQPREKNCCQITPIVLSAGQIMTGMLWTCETPFIRRCKTLQEPCAFKQPLDLFGGAGGGGSVAIMHSITLRERN